MQSSVLRVTDFGRSSGSEDRHRRPARTARVRALALPLTLALTVLVSGAHPAQALRKPATKEQVDSLIYVACDTATDATDRLDEVYSDLTEDQPKHRWISYFNELVRINATFVKDLKAIQPIKGVDGGITASISALADREMRALKSVLAVLKKSGPTAAKAKATALREALRPAENQLTATMKAAGFRPCAVFADTFDASDDSFDTSFDTATGPAATATVDPSFFPAVPNRTWEPLDTLTAKAIDEFRSLFGRAYAGIEGRNLITGDYRTTVVVLTFRTTGDLAVTGATTQALDQLRKQGATDLDVGGGWKGLIISVSVLDKVVLSRSDALIEITGAATTNQAAIRDLVATLVPLLPPAPPALNG